MEPAGGVGLKKTWRKVQAQQKWDSVGSGKESKAADVGEIVTEKFAPVSGTSAALVQQRG